MKASTTRKLKEIKSTYNAHRKNVNECKQTAWIMVNCMPFGVKLPECPTCKKLMDEYRRVRDVKQ